MPKDSSNGAGEPNVDVAASSACTRSGTFALLLSVLLFLLVPYWMGHKKDIALSEYLADRQNLAVAIDMLNESPLWTKYKASNEGAEQTSIAKLLGASVEVSPWAPSPNAVQPKPRTLASDKPQRPGAATFRPSPPTVLHVSVTEPLSQATQVSEIADLLVKLNNSEMLTLSRQVSHFYDFSIVRWVQERNSLLYRNVIVNDCFLKKLEVPHKAHPSDYFVPALDQDALLNCLNIGDVRQLARLELPTLSDPTQDRWPANREVELTIGSLSRDPFMASVLVQVLLVFVVMYFGAFAREAVASPAFPARGTLFGAFSKSRWTLLVLFLALWSPLAASLFVAAVSGKWVLIVCSVLIGASIFSVHSVLQGRSYFRDLNPLRIAGDWRRRAAL